MNKIANSTIRTILGVMLCVILWILSTSVFSVLPGILMFPAALIYYGLTIILYYFISGDDVVSTLIGLIISVFFIILYLVEMSSSITVIKIAFVIGILLGIVQTLHCISKRLKLHI